MFQKENLTLLRKYFFECVVLSLVGAVVSLFHMYLNLNTFVREEMIKQTIENVTTIKANNEILKEVNEHLLIHKN